MTVREAALLAVGIDVHPSTQQSKISAFSDIDSHMAFSGYGEFTPITVRSDTVIENADLERNQHRN